MNKDKILREQLLSLLFGHNAHAGLDNAIKGFPMEYINKKMENIPYTPWGLLEHIRLAQWDIVEFVVNPKHVSPEWPKGYWPDKDYIATPDEWNKTVKVINDDLERTRKIIEDSSIEILSEIPHAPGYTYFREIVLIADHNAYHAGELVVMRRALGIWK